MTWVRVGQRLTRLGQSPACSRQACPRPKIIDKPLLFNSKGEAIAVTNTISPKLLSCHRPQEGRRDFFVSLKEGIISKLRPRIVREQPAKIGQKWRGYSEDSPLYESGDRQTKPESVSKHFRRMPACQAWPSLLLGHNRWRGRAWVGQSPNHPEVPPIVRGGEPVLHFKERKLQEWP